MDFGQDFRDFRLDLKGFRPFSKDFISDFKDFRPVFRDFRPDFTDYTDFWDCRYCILGISSGKSRILGRMLGHFYTGFQRVH